METGGDLGEQAFRYSTMVAMEDGSVLQTCMNKSKQHSRYGFDDGISQNHTKLKNVDFYVIPAL